MTLSPKIKIRNVSVRRLTDGLVGIDEVQVYNRALGLHEVKELAGKYLPRPDCAPPRKREAWRDWGGIDPEPTPTPELMGAVIALGDLTPSAASGVVMPKLSEPFNNHDIWWYQIVSDSSSDIEAAVYRSEIGSYWVYSFVHAGGGNIFDWYREDDSPFGEYVPVDVTGAGGIATIAPFEE